MHDQEQGLSPHTISSRVFVLHDLLARLPSHRHSLRDVTIADLDRALASKLAQRPYGRSTISLIAGVLRTFFRFAARQRWCGEALVTAIRAPRVYSGEIVPWGPTWKDVQRLLITTAGNRPIKIRNRAIILLLAIYGLRAGEVARLRFEDFDWQQERLKIWRPKQRKAQVFPLARSAGDAVLRYLRTARPVSSYREVFLTSRAPYHPLQARALWPIVARPLRSLAVKLPHHGPHCLRHACATHLLNAGLTLKQIGDQLGHHDPESTRTYAKVDLPHLREVGCVDLSGIL